MADIFDSLQPQEISQNNFNLQNDNGDIFDSLSTNYETLPQNITRQGTRSFARAAETIVGLPGDLIDLLKTGLGVATEKIAGKKLPLFREALIKGSSSIKGDEFIPEALPTSQDIRQPLSELSKGYTEPKNELEKIGDEVVSDITALLIPTKAKIPFLRSIGTAIAANSAKQGVKALGAGETAQEATKIATMFLAGLRGRENADKFVSNLYKKAQESHPEGTMLESTGILKDLSKVERELEKGISTTTKKQVLSNVKELKDKASGGAIPLDDVIQSYRDINETMSSKNLFQELSKSEQRLLRKRYDSLKGVLNSAIENYGNYNPEFLKSWKDANSGYSAIQQSKKVSNSIQAAIKLKSSLLNIPALAVFGFYHPQAIIPTLGGLAGGTAAVKSAEILTRFSKNPILRRHYLNVIKEASRENIPAVTRELEKINKELEKV